MSKHLAGFSATGRVMLRRHKWTHSQCPRCFDHNEDALHTLVCPAPTARREWKRLLSDYWKALEEIETSPVIISTLKARLLPLPDFPTLHAPPGSLTASLLADQSPIGWVFFLYGRMSQSWRSAQDKWLIRQATRWKKSSLKWSAKFVRLTLDLSWGMWEHRNQVLHAPTHPWILAQEAPFLARLREVYTTLSTTQLLPSDRWLTAHPFESLLAKPAEARHQWYMSARMVLEAGQLSSNAT